MAEVVLVLLQGVLLLLLYLFVWRVARAIAKDLRLSTAPAPWPASGPAPAAAPPADGPPPRGVVARPTRGAPRELVVHVPDGRPQVLRLDAGDVTFGRSDRSTVPLTDQYASQQHARVYQDGDQWVVADLGSTNGTYLNKARITRPTPIGPGDQLSIGGTVVEVRR